MTHSHELSRACLRAALRASGAGWQPISTDDPRNGDFRFYGLHVKNSQGFQWFEVYYLARDTVDGDLIETGGDIFSKWSHDDFEVWSPAPQPPAPAMVAEEQTEAK